jgi:alkanesulfonate monooxygenase SsuD/methylene tetrahydromethanopterin reductase-like flavin-dependent oxidoreductase (luciferase family)
LGFGVTASVTYEKPYLLARTLTTLDHFTNGRDRLEHRHQLCQDSAARNLGHGKGQIPHDERYDRADEFMEVMYKLFEGSITPDALQSRCRRPTSSSDPNEVHGIEPRRQVLHRSRSGARRPRGRRAPRCSSRPVRPSPRPANSHSTTRRPIFFSGRHPGDPARLGRQAIRDGLEERGRARDAVKIFALATVIVDDTDEAAEARLADYRRYVDTESALSLFGGWTGVDLSGADPEDTLEYVSTEANQSALASFTTMAGDKPWTIRDLAEFVALGGRGPVITGSPETIVDEFERWMTEADIDGFNIAAAVRPADAERFAKYVSPELRRRGLLPAPTAGATVREQLTGAGPRLAEDHTGARYRLGEGARV